MRVDRITPTLFSLVCLLCVPITPVLADSVSLENGVTQTGLSGLQGEFLFYTLEVPVDKRNLKIQMDVTNGDPDLYVRFANQPTEAVYDCRPYTGGVVDETCTFPAAQAGTWHVMVHAYENFANAALTATYEDADPGSGNSGVLENGVTQTGLSGPQGEILFYTLEVPADKRNLKIQMDVTNGDPDLYVRFANQPTEVNYDCRPYIGGNSSEICSFTTPQAGTWHIMLHGYSDFTNASLTAAYEDADPGSGNSGVLENGVTQTGLSGLQGEFLFYTLEVPADSQNLRIHLAVTSGDPDLYVRYGSQPTEAVYDCRPYTGGVVNETCTFPAAQAGTWHVMVHAYENFANAALTATYEDADPGSGSSIRILPLGDSITQASSSTQSYRYPLWKKLIDASIDFDFIGSLTENNEGNPVWPGYNGLSFDQDHEGHWGWFTDEVVANIDAWLQGYTPADIALIHLGTNDSLGGESAESTINELRSTILSLRQKNPEVTVLLAQIIPSQFDTNGIIPQLNASIPALAAEMDTAASAVVVVDQATGFILAQDSDDGVHPNASGEEKMAQKWLDAILGNLPSN